jgi:hypothetical protein
MMLAAIVFGAGVMMEFYAIVCAPLGYQDEQGFHALAENADDEERGLGEKPS